MLDEVLDRTLASCLNMQQSLNDRSSLMGKDTVNEFRTGGMQKATKGELFPVVQFRRLERGGFFGAWLWRCFRQYLQIRIASLLMPYISCTVYQRSTQADLKLKVATIQAEFQLLQLIPVLDMSNFLSINTVYHLSTVFTGLVSSFTLHCWRPDSDCSIWICRDRSLATVIRRLCFFIRLPFH